MNTYESAVVAEIKMIVGDEAEVKVDPVDKGNGVIRTGVSVIKGKTNIVPTVYVPDKGADAKADAKRMLEVLEKHQSPDIDVSWFADYDKVKEHLFVTLTSHPAEGIVTQTAFCDLLMTAAIDVQAGVSGAIHVKESHLEAWGITKETLFEDALHYAKVNKPVKYRDLADIVASDWLGVETPKGFIVVSNKDDAYGASAVLYADLPRECYMIPSSRHEVIIVPPVAECARGLTEMVVAVNPMLDEVDVLANHAYHYVDGEWSIAD